MNIRKTLSPILRNLYNPLTLPPSWRIIFDPHYNKTRKSTFISGYFARTMQAIYMGNIGINKSLWKTDTQKNTKVIHLQEFI